MSEGSQGAELGRAAAASASDPHSAPSGRCPRLRTAVAFLAGAGLLAGLYHRGQFILKPQLPLLLLILLQLVWIALLDRYGRETPRERLRVWTPTLVLCGFLLLHLFSGAVTHPWFYFLHWLPAQGNTGASGMCQLALGVAVLTPVLVVWRRRSWRPLAVLFLLAQAVALGFFFFATRGTPLFRIDHPSFMFRLHEFGRAFPQLVNYMPHWNAGTVHFAGTPSGVAGPGLLLWPWLRAMPVHAMYTYGFAALFIVGAPWLGVAAVRAAGGDRLAAFTGGLLALGVSQHYFLWTLHYGTIGAGFSAAWVAPVCALAFRALWMRRMGWRGALALALCAFFLALWLPHAVILGVGLTAAALAVGRRWTWRTIGVLAAAGAGALLLYAPWLRALLTDGHDVIAHVMAPARGTAAAGWTWAAAGAKAAAGGRHLLDHLKEGHPVLLFLGLGGVLAGPRRGVRRWYLPILIVLALVTGWSIQIKPQSQLSRMSIALFYAALVPAALLAGRLLRSRDLRLAPVQAFLCVVLALGARDVARIYINHGRAPYSILEHPVPALVDVIRTQVPEGGRLLFAGRCVHAYGRGKVAYLPVLAGREMMASDYYGFPPGMAEYEYPPRPHRESLEGMLRFFELYDVTHVVTYHQRPWIEFFRGHPDQFAETCVVPSGKYQLVMFEVRGAADRLRARPWRVTADFNRLQVAFEGEPPDEVVLPYNWTPGLRAGSPARVAPHAVSGDIELIALRPMGKRAVTIRYRPPRGWMPDDHGE